MQLRHVPAVSTSVLLYLRCVNDKLTSSLVGECCGVIVMQRI